MVGKGTRVIRVWAAAAAASFAMLGSAALPAVALGGPATTPKGTITCSAPPQVPPVAWSANPLCPSPMLSSRDSGSPGPEAQGPSLPCLVAPQVNDRCPAWVSNPYQAPAGQDWLGAPGFQTGFPAGRLAVASPDASTVYAVGTVASGATDTCSLLGRTVSVAAEDVVVLAFAVADGSLRWQRVIGPLGADSEAEGVALTVSSDGLRVFATGLAGAPCQAAHEVTLAVDAASGRVDWLDELPQNDLVASLGRTVVAGPDPGRVYVAGSGYVGAHPTAATGYVRAIDATSGKELWRGYAPTASTSGDSLALDADGAVVVAGFDDHALVGRPTPLEEVDGTEVVDYDAATGSQRWSSHGTVGGFGGIVDIVASPDGSRLFTLTCDGDQSTMESVSRTRALAASGGSVLWETDYPGQANTACPSNGGNLILSPDGSRLYQAVIAAAPTPSASDQVSHNDGAAVTTALDSATGGVAWRAIFQQVPTEGTVLDRSADGATVYLAAQDGVCGNCIPPPQFVTVAYDAASGTQDWQAEYGNARSASRALAVPPGGSRVVAVGEEDQCGPGDVSGPPQAEAIIAVAYDAAGQPAVPGVGGSAPQDGVNCQAAPAVSVAEAPSGALPAVIGVLVLAVRRATRRLHRRRPVQ